jgi:hypothetical protein
VAAKPKTAPRAAKRRSKQSERKTGKNVLVVDIGGTSVKLLTTGQTERRSFPSGPNMKPEPMVAQIKTTVADWRYDVVSIGYPAPAASGRPLAEPRHLGTGWVGFDFAAAFGCPVKLVNDAAMQVKSAPRSFFRFAPKASEVLRAATDVMLPIPVVSRCNKKSFTQSPGQPARAMLPERQDQAPLRFVD